MSNEEDICPICKKPMDAVFGLTEFGHDHANERQFTLCVFIGMALFGVLFCWGMLQ